MSIFSHPAQAVAELARSTRRDLPTLSVPASGPAALPVGRHSTFWLTIWLAFALVVAKAAYFGLPEQWSLASLTAYQRTLAIASWQDVLFAVMVGLVGQVLLALSGRRARLRKGLWLTLVLFCTVSAFYGAFNVILFHFAGSPLTASLLAIAGGVGHMSSSVGHFATPRHVMGTAAVPLLFVGLVLVCPRIFPMRNRGAGLRIVQVATAILLVAYFAFASRAMNGRDWTNRRDRQIALNPHWVLATSFFTDLTAERSVHLSGSFPSAFMTDFESSGHSDSRLASLLPAGVNRPRNIITVVIESCPTRHMSLYGSRYKTTPRLDAEAQHALVFDNFYCHIGLTANSLAAIGLSVFPPVNGWPITSEQPALPGVMLQQLLKPRGYRTAFISSGDNDYLSQDRFLDNRGFDEVWDARSLERLLNCHKIFSWGVEDRCMVDGMLRWIDRDPAAPFYILGWTQQTHHPYEMTPGRAEIDFIQDDKVRDAYDYNNYLNCLQNADEQIGRLMDELRARGLADDTLIVVTGDHGEAFGSPHDVWGHGSHVYEENIHIPLMIWNPRLFNKETRLPQLASHVDLNPTLIDLLGIATPPPASWQGRSLFDASRSDRVYAISVNGDYRLCVRQGTWKYIFNATLGRDVLYDLAADPTEQTDVAAAHPDLCRDLRQRLAAWVKHSDDHYAKLINAAK